MTSNKTIGNHFETELCKALAARGFWAHNFRQDPSGQPADVIAVINGRAFLIDCKVCTYDGFKLSRMEENQDLSMTLWENCGNGQGFFALWCQQCVYMIPHLVIQRLQEKASVLRFNDFPKYGVPLEEWIKNALDCWQ